MNASKPIIDELNEGERSCKMLNREIQMLGNTALKELPKMEAATGGGHQVGCD